MTFQPGTFVHYPESDGQPMTESDPTRDYLIYCVGALELFFRSRHQVYVTGNLFIYFEEGNPASVVSPDVFVVFGASKRKRRSYKTWEEQGRVPSFVMEITSRTTKRQDEVTKPQLYANLGVQEYFQYDPTGDYLTPQLKGASLVDGQYRQIPLAQRRDGTLAMASEALGLDLCLPAPDKAMLSLVGREPVPRSLRFYDPKTGEKLLSYAESVESRDQAWEQAEQEREQAEQERQRAEQAAASQKAAIPKLLALGLSPEQVADTLGIAIAEVTPFLPSNDEP